MARTYFKAEKANYQLTDLNPPRQVYILRPDISVSYPRTFHPRAPRHARLHYTWRFLRYFADVRHLFLGPLARSMSPQKRGKGQETRGGEGFQRLERGMGRVGEDALRSERLWRQQREWRGSRKWRRRLDAQEQVKGGRAAKDEHLLTGEDDISAFIRSRVVRFAMYRGSREWMRSIFIQFFSSDWFTSCMLTRR